MTSLRGAYVLLVVMAMCWGGTWPAAKFAVEDLPAFTVAAARFVLATALLALWAASRGTLRRPERRDLPLIVGMGATAVAGYNAFFLFGLELAPATDGAIIVPGLAPVFTALLAGPVLGERIGWRGIAGLVLALAGLVVVIEPGGGVDSDRLAGAVLFVCGAVCWAVYSVIGKPATQRFGVVTATLYASAAGMLMLIPLSVADSGWSPVAGASIEDWAAIAYLAAFGTVIAFVLFYMGVRRIGASRTTAFALLVPVFGVLSSVLILDERLTASTVIGGLIVIAGLWLVQRKSAAEPVEPSRIPPRALQID